jgi:hypothetical protein
MKYIPNNSMGTEVSWTPQMLTDDRVHNTLMNIQSELRILRRTHEQNLQILSDIYLFYGMYFRPLLNQKFVKNYDAKLTDLKNKITKYKVSDNKKVVQYSFNLQEEFQEFLFLMLRDFQQSMGYFYKGKINVTSLDNIKLDDEDGK